MGRWLDAAKNQKPTHGQLTKLTKAPSVGFVSALPVGNQKIQDTESSGSVLPMTDKKSTDTPDSLLTKLTKVNAVSERDFEDPEPPVFDSTAPINPFAPARRPGPGIILCLSDLDHPALWTARRTGTTEPMGHGRTQLEAIGKLLDMEGTHGRPD